MIFFTPQEFLALSHGNPRLSPNTVMFGKRLDGAEGNAAAFKMLDRLLNGKGAVRPHHQDRICKIYRQLDPALNTEKLRQFIEEIVEMPQNLPSPWFHGIRGMFRARDLEWDSRCPRTVKLLVSLDFISLAAGNYSRAGRIEGLYQLLAQLPLTSTYIVDTLRDRLPLVPHDQLRDLFFPIRVLTLIATVKHLRHEVAMPENDGLELLELLAAWKAADDGPAPFRHCFDRMCELTSETSLERLFHHVIPGSPATRVREGRRYRQCLTKKNGKPQHPGTERCRQVVRRAQEAYRLAPEAVAELERLFFWARIVANIYAEGRRLSDITALDPGLPLRQRDVEWLPKNAEDEGIILREVEEWIQTNYSSWFRSRQLGGRSS
ncbi:hypothetical protein DWF04_016265 (plasmid) [Cereibacter sphaeroides f. sp. denitrificans]